MSTTTNSAESLDSGADSAYDHIVADCMMAADNIDRSFYASIREAVNVWSREVGLKGDFSLCLAVLRHSDEGPDQHYRKFKFDDSDPIAVQAALAKSALVNDVAAQM